MNRELSRHAVGLEPIGCSGARQVGQHCNCLGALTEFAAGPARGQCKDDSRSLHDLAVLIFYLNRRILGGSLVDAIGGALTLSHNNAQTRRYWLSKETVPREDTAQRPRKERFSHFSHFVQVFGFLPNTVQFVVRNFLDGL